MCDLQLERKRFESANARRDQTRVPYRRALQRNYRIREVYETIVMRAYGLFELMSLFLALLLIRKCRHNISVHKKNHMTSEVRKKLSMELFRERVLRRREIYLLVFPVLCCSIVAFCMYAVWSGMFYSGYSYAVDYLKYCFQDNLLLKNPFASQLIRAYQILVDRLMSYARQLFQISLLWVGLIDHGVPIRDTASVTQNIFRLPTDAFKLSYLIPQIFGLQTNLAGIFYSILRPWIHIFILLTASVLFAIWLPVLELRLRRMERYTRMKHFIDLFESVAPDESNLLPSSPKPLIEDVCSSK